MSKLVGENQAPFILGGQGTDNYAILQEIIHSVKRKPEELEL